MLRRLFEFGLIFVLGWSLSWVYFGHRNKQPQTITPVPSVDKINPLPADLSINSGAHVNQAPSSNVGKASYAHAAALLDDGRFTDYVQRYFSSQGRVDEVDTSQYRRFLFEKVYQLRDDKKIAKAIALLTLYLNYEYNNVEGLTLLASLYVQQENVLIAIDTLYKAKSYAYRSETIDELTSQIRTLTLNYRLRLKKLNDDMGMLALYTRLTELEPEYALNYIGLAETYVALGNNGDARTALSMVNHVVEVSGEVNKLLETINQTPPLDMSSSYSIPLIRIKDQFALDVVLNSTTNVRLLLDTGASLSIISPEVLSGLGIAISDANKKQWFNTANGMVESYIYTLQSLSLGDYRVFDIDVAAMDISYSGNIQGLLGMNYLKQFKFYIDQEKNVLYLQ